jgi:hypothetical protein
MSICLMQCVFDSVVFLFFFFSVCFVVMAVAVDARSFFFFCKAIFSFSSSQFIRLFVGNAGLCGNARWVCVCVCVCVWLRRCLLSVQLPVGASKLTSTTVKESFLVLPSLSPFPSFWVGWVYAHRAVALSRRFSSLHLTKSSFCIFPFVLRKFFSLRM